MSIGIGNRVSQSVPKGQFPENSSGVNKIKNDRPGIGGCVDSCIKTRRPLKKTDTPLSTITKIAVKEMMAPPGNGVADQPSQAPDEVAGIAHKAALAQVLSENFGR